MVRKSDPPINIKMIKTHTTINSLFLVALFFPVIVFGHNFIRNGHFETGNSDRWGEFQNQFLLDNNSNSQTGNSKNVESSLVQVFEYSQSEIYDLTFNYNWVSTGNYNMTIRLKDRDFEVLDREMQVLKNTPDACLAKRNIIFMYHKTFVKC
jgi:hypothetical protein